MPERRLASLDERRARSLSTPGVEEARMSGSLSPRGDGVSKYGNFVELRTNAYFLTLNMAVSCQ